MPRTGMLKLAIKFAIRSHNDKTALKHALMAGKYLPAYISPKRLNKAFDDIVR